MSIQLSKHFIFILLFLVFTENIRANEQKPFVVVLDAGHGGDDSGARGKNGLLEKDIALSVTLKLGAMIKAKYRNDVKIIYTRSKDVFIPLHKRAEIANKNNADLFISIHCNAARPTAMGTETFVLGLHREADHLDVAKRENSVILLEDNYETKYEGFNPNNPMAYIGFMLTVGEHQKQSIRMATLIEDSFVDSERESRGVKQAGFLVIRETAMPSVLVEIGFITNEEDAKLLMDEKDYFKTAKSLFNAFVNYKEEYDEKNQEQLAESNINEPTLKPVTKRKVLPDVLGEYKIQLLVSRFNHRTNSIIFKGLKNIKKIKIDGNYKYFYGIFKSRNKALSALDDVKLKGFTDAFLINQAKPISKSSANKVVESKIQKLKVTRNTPNSKEKKESYFIQLFFSKRNLNSGHRKFKGLKAVKKVRKGNYYYYNYGNIDNYLDAIQLYKELNLKGFKNAVIQKK